MAKTDKHPPAFQFYAQDFAASATVEAMSTEAVGAYILLLCKAWHQDPVGTIPDNDEVLARWARVSTETWARIRDSVLAAFTLVDGRWHQERMQSEWTKLLEFKRERSQAGIIGNQKRWHADIAQRSLSDRSAIANASQSDRKPIANASQNDRSSSSSSSSDLNNTQRACEADSEPLPEDAGAAAFLAGPSAAFQRFWQAYPRRMGRADAWAAFQVAVAALVSSGKTEPDAETFLIDSAKRYAEAPAGSQPSANAKSDYRPAPAKWLREERFYDDPATWQKPNQDGEVTNGKHQRGVRERIAADQPRTDIDWSGMFPDPDPA